MIATLAQVIVVLAGLFLVALGAVALARPDGAGRFLLGFADSPGKHYAELALRMLVGGAFLLHSPRMAQGGTFALFGWLLVLSTAGLLLVPWRWHHRFAQAAVPRALRHLSLVGTASLLLGGTILVAAVFGAKPGGPG